MINEKKIRLMTRAAMIEERDNKGIFISKKFQYKDFVIFQISKSVIVITVAYALFLLILFLLNMEDVADSATVSLLAVVFWISIALYVILLVLTVFLTVRSCKDAYKNFAKELGEYKYVVNKLEKEAESVDKAFL